MCFVCDMQYDDGSIRPTSVVEYIYSQMSLDDMKFSNPLYNRLFQIAIDTLEPFYRDLEQYNSQVEAERQQYITTALQEVNDHDMNDMDSHAMIHAMEREQKQIEARANAQAMSKLREYRAGYLMKILCSHPDDEVRQLAGEMAIEPYQLSKIHTQFATVVDEIDKLPALVEDVLYNWKNALLDTLINQMKQRMANSSPQEQPALMQELMGLYDLRRNLSQLIGVRVVNP